MTYKGLTTGIIKIFHSGLELTWAVGTGIYAGALLTKRYKEALV